MAMDDIQIPAPEMKRFGQFLRRNRIGTSVQQGRRSIERYEDLHGNITAERLRENFSGILIDCFQIETEIFFEIVNEIRGIWVQDLLEYENRNEDFPNISNLVDQTLLMLDENITNEQKVSGVINILQRVNHGVSLSMKQSGNPRAGAAFENYLEHFFQILGFQFEPQGLMQNGQKLDFVLPSVEFFRADQDNSIWIECQTSLRDRFALTTGKQTEFNERSTKFYATIAGLNLANAGDDADLNDHQINRITGYNRQHPWRVITLRQVAEDRNSPTVISFEDFVNNEYPRISQRW